MPIFSLPSPYGIGTFGQAAYDFVDFLDDAGQRYWQILPLGPHKLRRLAVPILLFLRGKPLLHRLRSPH